MNGDPDGSPQHLDGTVTSSDKNYNFIGVALDLSGVYALVIDLRDHGKPDVDLLQSRFQHQEVRVMSAVRPSNDWAVDLTFG